MKILLVNPAFFDGNRFRNRYKEFLEWIRGGNLYVAPFEPPLGLAFLSAYLKENGHEVELLDMQGLMLDSASLVERISQIKPDLVGITAMTPTLPAALRVAEYVGLTCPNAKIVVGGVHPTLDPLGVLRTGYVDYVIRGEGEKALAELAHALENNLPLDSVDGLCLLGRQPSIKPKAARIEDLDLIPRPDYAAFPIERYIEHNRILRGIRGISMIVSRGCPFPCTFCAVHQTMGRKWRIRSPRVVVDEIRWLRDNYQIEGIWFKDSIFNLNRGWVKEFCRLMVEENVGVSWQANTRVDLIREEEVALMKSAGLMELDLGIETGSPRSLERLKKGITVDQIRDRVRLAKKYVKVFGFFMIGIPGEEEADVLQTFELAKDLDLDRWTWSIYSPLPGSALYQDLIEEGKIDPGGLDYSQVHFTEAYEGICNIEPGRLKELYREINDYFCSREAAS